MQYRVGQCTSCNASFKVPASFQANKAKCKKCGGVVEIGEVQGDAPAEASEPKPVPARKPGRTPAAKGAGKPAPKGEGKKSMKERLLEQRAAESEKSAKSPQRPGASRRRGAGSGKAGSTTGGRKTAAERTAERESRRAAGRRQHEKQRNPAVIVGGLVLAIAAVFGFWKMFLAGGTGEATADSGVAQAAGSTVEPGSGDDAGGVQLDADPETDGTAEAPVEAGADETPEEAPEETAPPEPKPAKVADPSSVDLMALEDFGPADDTSEEEWGEIKRKVVTAFDPDAGAAGGRARKALEGYGRKAFPAIVNAMKRMNFATEQGRMDGDVAQKTLQYISNGRNVGWKYSTEPADVLYNKKAVKKLWDVWEKAKDDMKYWEFYAKIDKKDSEAAEEETGIDDEALDDLDDLDDLDG